MPISHVNIYVRNGQLDKMTDWYLKALAPLGYADCYCPQSRAKTLTLFCLPTTPPAALPYRFKKHYDLRPQHPTIGIGAQWPEFWLAECPVSEAVGPPKERAHIAFYTKNRQHVRDFHALALYVMFSSVPNFATPPFSPHISPTPLLVLTSCLLGIQKSWGDR